MNPCLLLRALAATAPLPRPGALKADQLVGEWVVQSLTKGGETTEFPQSIGDRIIKRFTSDGALTWPDEHQKDGGLGKQTYTLDTSADPARIDVHVDLPSGTRKTYLGILTIDRDKLTLAIAPDGSDRPTRFDSSKLDSTHVWIYKRLRRSKE